MRLPHTNTIGKHFCRLLHVAFLFLTSPAVCMRRPSPKGSVVKNYLQSTQMAISIATCTLQI